MHQFDCLFESLYHDINEENGVYHISELLFSKAPFSNMG